MPYSALSDDISTLSQFTRRKTITLTTGGTSTPLDYQVKLNITHESEMQADFGDIRFNTKTGAYIDYWIEDYVVSTTATVWIKLPDAITDPGSDTIWMYYGNSCLSAGGDGDDTFIFFDDFIGTNGDPPDMAKWDLRNTPTIQGNMLQNVDDEYVVSDNSYDVRGKAIRWKSKFSDTARQYWIIGDVKDISTTNPATVSGQDAYVIDRYDAQCRVRHYTDGVRGTDWEDLTYFSTYAGTNWHELEIATLEDSPYSTKFWVKKASWENVYTEDWQHSGYNMYIYAGFRRTSEAVISLYDWVFVREYIVNEPTIAYGIPQHQRRIPQFIG